MQIYGQVQSWLTAISKGHCVYQFQVPSTEAVYVVDAGRKGRGCGVATRLCSVRPTSHPALHFHRFVVLLCIAICLIVRCRLLSLFRREGRLRCRMHFVYGGPL